MLASIAATAPAVKSFLGQIGTTQHILCAMLDAADSWFLYFSFQGSPESIRFHWQSQRYTFKFFQKVEILMVLTITPVCYIDDIVLIKCTAYELAGTLGA